MIELDGAFGEGGGQILRTTIALSALTMQPVNIYNIRAGRPKPGLKRQHLAGLEVLAQLVSADVSGLEVGSTQVEFAPRERKGGHFSYDVGTAGSISLVLQAALPAAVLSPEPVIFSLTGGTDVAWSPTIDYMREVFVHALQAMGPAVEIAVSRRGHFPRGGGKVTCTVTPVESITPMERERFGEMKQVRGISHCVRLPPHVAERQANSAQKKLNENGITDVLLERESYTKQADRHLGTGSGIALWAESVSGVRLGADNLGARKKRAEDVGSECAEQLLKELSTGMAVDSHLCDMLVPYMGLADGVSRIGVTEITSHLKTNIWAAEKLLAADFSLQGELGEPGTLVVGGAGLAL
ncbi:MAG: RNA 3'-terminal phosphate cyclase [Candidatus Thorarchaeota archaeon]|jgi:RNA 3'-phosphate cyclase